MIQISIFRILPIFALLFSFAHAKYLDNHSCNECHEKIYEEYQGSSHANSYFTNDLHRSVADRVSTTKYDCATCHMPMADNIKELISGKARPDKSNKTHIDGVSCYFCHTVAYVRTAHKFNINTKARQAKNFKPTLYGRLVKPDDSDKHSSTANPVYAKKVCTGCHSHKVNDNNSTIFRAMTTKQDSISCIECHMPELVGGAEKINKKTRANHASHKFLGIHDKEFRKTGMDINITTTPKSISVHLKNKMTHPLIVQPARAKYLRIELTRAGKLIWSNYKSHPNEDKQGYFAYSFDKSGQRVVIPAKSTSSSVNNVAAKSTRVLEYKTPALQKGDEIKVALYLRLAKKDCAEVVSLGDTEVAETSLMRETILIVK